jgi:hypothetical protein
VKQISSKKWCPQLLRNVETPTMNLDFLKILVFDCFVSYSLHSVSILEICHRTIMFSSAFMSKS